MKRNENIYKKSGVNISLANKLVKYISLISKKDVKKTKSLPKKDVIGGFGSLFDISKIKIKDPVIVSCTDGVGTKIDLANKFKKFDTIGIDLVAMCINDLIVQGAKPLFFLDYIAVGKLNLDKAKKILKGIFKGCKILIAPRCANQPRRQTNKQTNTHTHTQTTQTAFCQASPGLRQSPGFTISRICYDLEKT